LVDVDLNQRTLNVALTQDLDVGSPQSSQWKTLAAGDIDREGKDELILAREVSDGRSATVLAFKWDPAGSIFRPFATSTFGNNGNSKWSASTASDFNADGRQAIVLVKNQHPNFVLLDLAPGTTQPVLDPALPPNPAPLRTLSVADLDSTNGQDWTGLVATDWLFGDQGAAELIAIRAVTGAYRTNIFVYGNGFHRVSRDTGLAGTKAQYIQHILDEWIVDDAGNGHFASYAPPPSDLKMWLSGTHTNTLNWVLNLTQETPHVVHDYSGLVDFLAQTKNFGVDGKHLRVWVTLVRPYRDMKPDSCSLPEDTSKPQPGGKPPLTSWNALDFFKQDFSHDYDHLTDDEKVAACKDLLAWASLLGRLARDFPHLVAVGIDDFSDSLGADHSTIDCTTEFRDRMEFNQDCIAQIEARLRSQAPWLNFVPTVYHDYYERRQSDKNWADLGLTLDSMLFFFRNEEHGTCIDWTSDCERTVNNAPDEIRDMGELLPAGRKLQVGMYFAGCSTCSLSALPDDRNTPPRIRYDYDLARLALNMPAVGGAMAYGLQTPPRICSNLDPQKNCLSFWAPCTGTQCVANCTDTNFLQSNFPGNASDPSMIPYNVAGTDRYCALREAYSEQPQRITHIDRTQEICFSQPSCPPAAVGTPFGYVSKAPWVPVNREMSEATLSAVRPFPLVSVQNVVFRDMDGHVHRIWQMPHLRSHDNLSVDAQVPAAAGDPKAYVFAAQGLQNVVYRDANGNVHRLFWPTDPPADHEDLTASARVLDPNHVAPAAGDPFGYVIPFQGVQNVLYPGNDGVLHGLWWFGVGDPAHNDLLTTLSGAPPPTGDAVGYVAITQLQQNAVYVGNDGHLHRLFWSAGPVTPDDLTQGSGTPKPSGVPIAYFNELAGLHHVFYRGPDRVPTTTILCTFPDPNPCPYRLRTCDFCPPAQPQPRCNGCPPLYSENGGDVYELWGNTTPTNSGKLSGDLANAPLAQSNLSAYFVAADHTNHAFYNYMGYVHELWWREGASGANRNNLTAIAGAPVAASDPSAYFDVTDGTHHVIYRSSDGHSMSSGGAIDRGSYHPRFNERRRQVGQSSSGFPSTKQPFANTASGLCSWTITEAVVERPLPPAFNRTHRSAVIR
jgi:hypothetical protein